MAETVHAPVFRLLLWAHWRMFLAQLRGIQAQSRLLLSVLTLFVLGYLVIGYWAFYQGLAYLHRVPIVGSLLAQRVVFLIYGLFFLMLMFSNLIVGYSTLFKNRETEWLLSLPISHRAIYRWKFLESLVVSSWALVFLSAPLMIAYGRVNNVSGSFYAGVICAYLPFVVIPAVIGSCGIVFLVRLFGRAWLKKAALLLAIATILLLVLVVRPVSDENATSAQDVLIFDQLLRHTRTSLNPILPSSWLARSLLLWSQGLFQQGAFFFLVLLANAMMCLVVGFEIVGRSFYSSWSIAATSRAQRSFDRGELKRQRSGRQSLIARFINAIPLRQSMRALVLKDARLFWREPAQWTQFMIFFGLLGMYVLNLRNVAFNYESEFWATVISYLNLAASALTLSTLTTRFVFPQFSLEGRRLWIVGLAPIGLQKLLLQKFWMSCIVSIAITGGLMVLSSVMLKLYVTRILFFAGAIAVMSATLCGLAIGLGALFPNLKEDNPSKIVSGFGGTLCLVVSFLYITCFVALTAIPEISRSLSGTAHYAGVICIGAALLMSGALLFIPLTSALRRVKNLEF